MSEVFNKYKGTIIGIVFIIVGMLFYLIMQIFNIWTNPPEAGPGGFCEYFNPNLLVGEPMNAWSCFYFVGAGMILIVYHDLVRMGNTKKNNKYIIKQENLHYILIYGILIIWVGIASFYMHGSYRSTPWFSAGFLDVFSMNLYMSGIIIMSLAILFDIKKRNFYILFLLDLILILILMKFNLSLPSLGGGGLFELLLIFAFGNEILIGLGIYSKTFKSKGARQIRRNIILLPIIVLIFLIGFWLWHFGLRDASTCDPYSWWQWHAVWHFSNVCSMILIIIYILTEREIKLS